MKKILVAGLVAMCLTTSFPMTKTEAVGMITYDPSTEYQVIQQVANSYKQIEMQLQNLSGMDASTAAANSGQIQQNLAQMAALQQQMQGFVSDYSKFQQQWDSAYGSNSGNDYANQVQNLMQTTENSINNAMRNQAYVRSQIPGNATNLNNLLNASQSAQGALAAAQAGNQIAGIQAQQMMMLSQMLSTQNDAQMAYQEQQKKQQEMSQNFADEFFTSGSRTTEASAGMPNF